MPRHARLRCHRRSVRRCHDPLSTVPARLKTTRLRRTTLCTVWTTAHCDCAARHMPVRNFRRAFGAYIARRIIRDQATGCNSRVALAGAISAAEPVSQAGSDACCEGVHVGTRHPLLGWSLEQVEDLRAAKFRRWTCDNVHVHMLKVFEFREEHHVRL